MKIPRALKKSVPSPKNGKGISLSVENTNTEYDETIVETSQIYKKIEKEPKR